MVEVTSAVSRALSSFNPILSMASVPSIPSQSMLSSTFLNLSAIVQMMGGIPGLVAAVPEFEVAGGPIYVAREIDKLVERKPVIFQVAHMSPETVLGGREEISTKLSKIVGVDKITRHMTDFAEMHVVVPKLTGVGQNLPLCHLFDLDINVKGLPEKVKVSQVWDTSLPFRLYTVENDKFLVGDRYYDQDYQFPIEACDILATAALNIPYRLGKRVDIYHLLGWESAMVATKALRYKGDYPAFYGDTKIIFEPIEFRLLGRSSFPAEYYQKVVGTSEYYDRNTMAYHDEVSLLKAGLYSPQTDLVVALNRETMEKAKDEQRYGADLGTIVSHLVRSSKLHCLFDRWSPEYTPERIAQAYLEILKNLFPRRGMLYTLDLTDMMIRAVERGEVSLDSFVMNLREWEPEATPITNLYLNMIDHPVLSKTRENLVTGFAPGTRMETGSAILGAAKVLISSPNYCRSGRNQIALNGGLGTRLGVVTVAEGAKKGNVRILGKRLFEIASTQTLPIFAQLPEGGRGKVLIYGTDNILIAAELMVGVFPLRKAKQGILLFDQPQEILGVEESKIKYVEGLGVLLADPFSGDLLMFMEKKKLPVIQEHLLRRGITGVFINTFIMEVDAEALEEMVALYGRPSPKNGTTPLDERDIDWSKHIITPMTLAQDVWLGRYLEYYLEKKLAAQGFCLELLQKGFIEAREAMRQEGATRESTAKLGRAIDRLARLLAKLPSLSKEDAVRDIEKFKTKSLENLPEFLELMRKEGFNEHNISEIQSFSGNILRLEQILLDRILTQEEWALLWENANYLKRKYGVGVVNIGDNTNSKWFDTGTPEMLKLVYQQAVSDNPQEAAIIRRHFGIREGKNIVNSFVGPYVGVPEKENFLVLNSVLIGTGRVSPRSVVTDSFVINPEVNPFSVVTLSDVSARSVPEAGTGGNNLIYRFRGSEDELTKLVNSAASTCYFKSGEARTGVHSLSGVSADTVIPGLGLPFDNLFREKIPPYGTEVDYARGLIEDASLRKKIRNFRASK